MEKTYAYLINKIFSVPYIDRMLKEQIAPESFVKCIQRISLNERMTYRKALSAIYNYMDLEYRNEYYYKNTLLNQLLIDNHELYNTAALTELPIAESKADFVMINGRGCVYEIKTDLDNLQRLESQIEDYYKVFSYVYVVVGSKQIERLDDFLLDNNVGIYELSERGKLIKRKKAFCNHNRLSYEAMFQILRKTEFESIILKHYNSLPLVNSFQYYRECLKWMKKIRIITLQKDVLQCLKERTIMNADNRIEQEVPYELRFYSYFSKEYRSDYGMLNAFLDKKMEV